MHIADVAQECVAGRTSATLRVLKDKFFVQTVIIFEYLLEDTSICCGRTFVALQFPIAPMCVATPMLMFFIVA